MLQALVKPTHAYTFAVAHSTVMRVSARAMEKSMASEATGLRFGPDARLYYVARDEVGAF